MDGDNKKVLVSVRIRPKLERATTNAAVQERYALECCTRMSDTTVCLSEQKGKDTKSYVFCFDAVYDKDNTQEDVYEDSALDLVDSALQGNFSTILAYGQTGSGKTYTVLGAVKSNPLGDDILIPETGLLLRAFRDLLSYRDKHPKLHMVFCLSVIEIYCEVLRDLLGDDPDAFLKVGLDDTNMYIPDLKTIEIRSIADVMKWYKVAMSRRISRATQSNDQSSRSHALFTIDIFQQEITPQNPTAIPLKDLMLMKDRAAPSSQPGYVGLHTLNVGARPGPPVVYSKIVFADLAGSEKVKKSESQGKAFEEMVKINGSLTSLGNVVHSLFTNAKHIPYRDSKLTILLRSAFSSANSRVALIANMSPTSNSFDETLSTLYFANKVKAMKVAANAAHDVKLENDYLATLKACEELQAEMRISKVSQDYIPGRMRAASTIVVYPFYVSKAAGVVTPALKAKKEADVTKCAQAWQLIFAKFQEDKKRERAEELQRIFKEHKENELRSYNKLIDTIMEKINAEDKDITENQKALGQEKSDWEHEIAAAPELEAKLVASTTQLSDHKKSLQTKLQELLPLQMTLDEETKRKVTEFRTKHELAEKQWEDFERISKLQDTKYEIQRNFATSYLSYRSLHSSFNVGKLDNAKLFHSVVQLKYKSEKAEASTWIRHIVLDLVHRACVKSDLSTGRPSPARQDSVRSRPGDAAVVYRGTSVYDSPTIVSDILNYLQSGSILLKFGKSGVPRYRKFFIAAEMKPTKQVEHVLHWEDPGLDMSFSTGRTNSGIEINNIRDIILGQSTKYFKRAKERANQTQDEYYLSFSIVYVKKQHLRSVNVIVDSVSEFEAWILGLCHLAHKQPIWGEPMSVEAIDGSHNLESEELMLCRTHHIRPVVFIKIRDQLSIAKRELTRGELRMLTPLDYFRASALWEHLVKRGIIIDPFAKKS